MSNLPQRPREHVLETESRKFVENILPSEWIVTSSTADYGIDLHVEIVENTYVTGAHFSMQLKSTDKIKLGKDGFVSYSCKTSTLKYFLEKTEPVIFLIYDAKNKLGYWIWIKEFIRNSLNRKWKKQGSATIKISNHSLFTHENLSQIKARVMRTHRQARLLSTIQTLDNPYIRYTLQADDKKEVIMMSPKYPGVEKDYPLNFDIKFTFDKSFEGQHAQQSLQDAMRKGMPTEIDGKFIESVEFPELIDPEIFGNDEFKPDKLLITPISQNRTFSTIVTILDQNEVLLSQIPIIEFREKHSGSDEITFSNDNQPSPIKFSITLNLIEHKATITFKIGFDNLNAFQAFGALKIQKAFATGSWLCLSLASTNTAILKSRIPANLIPLPPEILIEVASKLTHIQEKTGQVIPWPQKITYDEKYLIDEIVSVIDTGQAKGGNYISFGLEKLAAQKLFASSSEDERHSFRIEANERYATLFGQNINLGAVSMMILNARPNIATISRLVSIEETPIDAFIQIELEVDDPGIEIYHHRWSSPEIRDKLKFKNSEENQDVL